MTATITPITAAKSAAQRLQGVASEREFLPAALEIVETPASPTGRLTATLIITMFLAALAWACLGQIDIVATAAGKIVPGGRVKIIQPFESGVVRAIHVTDGQRVRAGETLIELDPTMSAAEQKHLRSDLMALKLEIARLHAIVAESGDAAPDFRPPEGASAQQIAVQRQYLVAIVGEHRAKLAGIDRQHAQKLAEAATISATIAKLRATIPLVQERVTIRSSLKDYGSKLNYYEVLQALTEQQEELKVQLAHLVAADAAASTIAEMRSQTIEEFRRTRFGELADAQRKAEGLAEDLVKAERRTSLQGLTSPIDGVVQQLAIHTVGGVVTPAQALLVVVPSDSPLEIEASISNRDIGFVRAGQVAEIKVDTFNFTRYGLVHGRVVSLSPDSIVSDRATNKSGDRASTREAEASRTQDPSYSARISLDQASIRIEDARVALTPGMAVTVEINTGSRSVISFLLSPLARYRHESLRER